MLSRGQELQNPCEDHSGAVYFTFVTGLTIGYGDIVPRQAVARALTIGIGLSGLFLTGLIAGIAVYAMRTAINDHDGG
jgi:ion channel